MYRHQYRAADWTWLIAPVNHLLAPLKLIVDSLQLFLRFFRTIHKMWTGQYHRFNTLLDHQFSRARLERVDDGGCTDGTGRADFILESLDLDHGIARRRAVIDHDV